MNEIYSKIELTIFNSSLVNGGYNAFDNAVGKTISIVESDKDAAKISRILLKYSNHIAIDIEKMQKSLYVYDRSLNRPIVYIDSVDNSGIWCKWTYSPKVKQILDSYNSKYYKWYKDLDGWKCRISFVIVKSFYKDIKRLNYDVEDLETAITNNSFLIAQALNDSESTIQSLPKGVIKLSVGREGTHNLSIRFDSNNSVSKTVIAALDTLATSEFHKIGSFFTISLTEVCKLADKLEEYGVKTSDLDFWVCQMAHLDTSEVKDYTFLKREPYPYQIDDVRIMLKEKAFINANQMGCGKTFECVMTGESLADTPKLVICPASLRLNWKKEIKMVNPDADIVVLRSSDEFHTGKDWTIVSYNTVPNFQFLLECQYFQCIFIDEAHFIKAVDAYGNPDSIRAYAVLRVSATAEYVYPVTGTPISNRNRDIWNLLKLIRHPLTTRNNAWSNFRETYCSGSGSSNNHALYLNIKDFMIRHLKSEVLPDLKKQRTFIPNDVDLKEYEAEIEEYLRNRESTAAEQLARLSKARVILASKKAPKTIKFADELLEQGEQVIIATNYNYVVNACRSHYGDKAVFVVGGMSDAQKDASVTAFQSGEKKVFIGNITAAGVGLTLTKGKIVIINDYCWNPGDLLQMEDRVSRPGQIAECCDIFYMYAEGADMDELFTATLTNKMDSINAAIDNGEDDTINMLALVREMLENKARARGMKPVDISTKERVKRDSSEPTDADLINDMR
jgi:SNF2 family DNA or RNA helicase